MNADNAAGLAVLFPGQGSQQRDMGRDLAEEYPEVMDLWKKAERISGLALREIYWDSDETAMADTRNLQPAMTVTNLSLWVATRKRLKPACLAGHSLGEYSALAVARVLELDEILSLVSLRGRLMAEADPDGQGAMSAIVKLNLAQVEGLVAQARQATGQTLVVANYNTPGQYVISGSLKAVEAAEALAKEAKGRPVRLPVSGAFHSPLMTEAAKELAAQMSRYRWQPPTIPVVFNITADTEDQPQVIEDIMARQMINGVRWIETIQKQWQIGARRFVELGPKGVLTKMMKSIIDPEQETYQAVNLSTLEETRAFEG